MGAGGNGPDPEVERAEEEILFPFREVTLFGPGGAPGERVLVKAWDVDTWAEAVPHLIDLQKEIARKVGKVATVADVVRAARPEVETLICITVGWSQTEFRQKVHTAEEFLALTEAVWVTSIRRPGGGVLPLLIRMIAAGTELVMMGVASGLVESPWPKRSTDSSEPATPSPKSAQ